MSPFKMSTMKGGSNKGKAPVIDVDKLSLRPKRARSPTGVYDPDKSDLMLHFRTIRDTLKMLYCWLKGLLTNHLFLKPKSLNGLPPRIGTSFSPTLMMLTRTWWKSSMLMPFQKERSSNVGLEEKVSQWHPSIWQKSFASTGQYSLTHRYMMNWIQMRRFFEKL